MKRTVVFRDANKCRVSVDFELKTKTGSTKNWETLETVDSYKTLSISGVMGGSCGQIDSHIKPVTATQKKLLAIWNKWHLNDMKAGTKVQEECFDSVEYHQHMDLIAAMFTGNRVWQDAERNFYDTYFPNGRRKVIFRVNRGRGYETYLVFDKDGKLVGFAGDTLTTNDKEYARGIFWSRYKADKIEHFKRVLSSCLFNFYYNYDKKAHDIGLKCCMECAISYEKLAKYVCDWFDFETVTLKPEVISQYDFRCLILKLCGKYSDRGYLYGHGWLLNPLPEDMEDQINALCDAIETENVQEAESAAESLDSVDGVDWSKDLSDIDSDEDTKYLKALQSAMDVDDFVSRIALALGKALGESAAEGGSKLF